jgi:Spy/CpxP family protein refolding chaperone
MDLQRQLQVAVFADAPDAGTLDELKASIAAAEAEAVAHRVATQTKIAQVLTAEQRAKAREILSRAPHAGRGRGW